MPQTTLTRTGSFDTTKLNVLESQLKAVVPGALQVYGTSTGLQCDWPNGLTAGQKTTAQATIAAYVQPTDASFLTPLQQQALAFLAIASPTEAQQNAALKGIIKYLLSINYKQPVVKTSIDGQDLTV